MNEGIKMETMLTDDVEPMWCYMRDEFVKFTTSYESVDEAFQNRCIEQAHHTLAEAVEQYQRERMSGERKEQMSEDEWKRLVANILFQTMREYLPHPTEAQRDMLTMWKNYFLKHDEQD